MVAKILYRCGWKNTNPYAEFYSEQTIVIIYEELTVVKETTKCYVVNHGKNKRNILKDQSGKRYAYETKERALEAFIIKRESYHRKLKSMLKNNERLIKISNETAQ